MQGAAFQIKTKKGEIRGKEVMFAAREYAQKREAGWQWRRGEHNRSSKAWH
jgi:hypothetical protein